MLREFFLKLWRDERGIAPVPPPVDPVTTAIFIGSLVGPALFKILFGGDSQEDRASNFSQQVVDNFGQGEFSVDFAGFSAFRSAEGSPLFFSRQIFDPDTGFRAGTAFFSGATGELVQVRDASGNLTSRIPGIVQGRFTWTGGDKQKEGDLEGSLELAIKNELKKKQPIPDAEQTEETRARARCTGSGLMLVNGTHCASPEEFSACETAGNVFVNGACVPPTGPFDGDVPESIPPGGNTVQGCQGQGRTFVAVDQPCGPRVDLNLTGPIDRVDGRRAPGRSRVAPTDESAPDANGECSNPLRPIRVGDKCFPAPGPFVFNAGDRPPPRGRSGQLPPPADPTFTVEVTECLLGERKIMVPVGPGGTMVPVCIPGPKAKTPPGPPGPPPVDPGPLPPGPEIPGTPPAPIDPCILNPELAFCPGNEVPEPGGPSLPELALTALAAGAGGRGGSGFGFANGLSVGGQAGPTLFPALQAQNAPTPGLLLQFMANMAGRR